MSYNTPVRILQQGSVLEVGPSGTVSVLAGGSIQNAGGQSYSGSVTFSGSVSITGVVSAANGITLGGTAGRWAYGTVGLASGVGTIATGLTTVVSAWANVISGVQGGAGSMSSAVADMSLSASGSVIWRGLAGTLAFTGNNGTICWAALGV
jgi:hypothetical protein